MFPYWEQLANSLKSCRCRRHSTVSGWRLIECLTVWRRGWDSNPRYGRTVHLISNQAHSTTLAPLHISSLQMCGRPMDASTPDLTRRYAPRPSGAHCVRPKRLRRLVESGPLSAGVLPAALRAASRFKIALCDFVDHSGTSPWRRPLRGCGLYAMGGASASQNRQDIAARSLKL